MKYYILLFLLLFVGEVEAMGVVHKSGTDVDWNNNLVSKLNSFEAYDLHTIIFDYKNEGFNGFCGYYYFWDGGNILFLYCKDEYFFWHEIGHHVDRYQYNNFVLSEDFAWAYSFSRMEAFL